MPEDTLSNEDALQKYIDYGNPCGKALPFRVGMKAGY